MQTNQGVNTVSSVVYASETVTVNGARNSCASCCGRHGCLATTFKFLLFILPVCEVATGALFYSGCQNSMIPTFLLVLGVLSLPLAVNVVFPKLIREPARTVLMTINFFVLLGWFIAGNIWTFQRFPFLFEHYGLFSIAVRFITINYMLLILIIVYLCLYCCRRQYRVRDQSGTYIDVNKFYKQNMASSGFTQSVNPPTTGQQMWIQVPTEDPVYLPPPYESCTSAAAATVPANLFLQI
ncbi:uncharacterized protein V6R79_009701 [Siganus canaliculatus]